MEASIVWAHVEGSVPREELHVVVPLRVWLLFALRSLYASAERRAMGNWVSMKDGMEVEVGKLFGEPVAGEWGWDGEDASVKGLALAALARTDGCLHAEV